MDQMEHMRKFPGKTGDTASDSVDTITNPTDTLNTTKEK